MNQLKISCPFWEFLYYAKIAVVVCCELQLEKKTFRFSKSFTVRQ